MNGFEEIYSNTVLPKFEQNGTSYYKQNSNHEVENDFRSQYLNGPDQVLPSNSMINTKRNGTVKIRMGDAGIEAITPISIPSLLNKTASQYPDRVAMVYKDEDGIQRTISFKEYRDEVRTCAKAFLKLGLQRHHSVGILGMNSKEWIISYMAAIHAGGFAVGIYTTNSPDACQYCLEDSGADIAVVEDDKQLQKILQIKHRLPNLKAIVQYSGRINVRGIYSWKDVLKLGNDESEEILNQILKTMAVNECCNIIYTSGTTGNPKPVMITHDNLTWSAKAIEDYCPIKACENEITVSYLPLSHIAAQVVDIIITLTIAASLHFADKNAFKGSLLQTLQEARPTFFFAVPRVWEKIQEKMVEIGAQSGFIKRVISATARSIILRHNTNKMNGGNGTSLSYMIARQLIATRVKKALGLDRCKIVCNGSAPISSEIKKFFMSLDIKIMEVYGMSECVASSLAIESAFNLDSVGKNLPGVHIKIRNSDNSGEGEICCCSRGLFMGYLNKPELTAETLDEHGWLCSGDLGKLDTDGFLYITGRSKDLIITAGGENIASILIENAVKAELPCVSHAVLIGDRRKFLSILLTLKTEVDAETGEPMDVLTKQVKKWCDSVGCVASTVTEVLQGPNEKIMSAIQDGIHRANEKAISKAQYIQKFAILPKDFSIHTGELGPTLKLKRSVILQKHADIIENFYKN